ncbi:hypothetical protein D3C76_1475470 [compost metagenome]
MLQCLRYANVADGVQPLGATVRCATVRCAATRCATEEFAADGVAVAIGPR